MNVEQIEFNIERRERLRAAYKRARVTESSTFEFEGHEYMTDYAKYLLEYLDLALK